MVAITRGAVDSESGEMRPFGEVLAGLDVLEGLTLISARDGSLQTPVRIRTCTLVDGDEAVFLPFLPNETNASTEL